MTTCSADDAISGLDRGDALSGEADNVSGGPDTISGGESSDSLKGGDGNDDITGGPGEDTIDSRDLNPSGIGERDVVDCGPGQDHGRLRRGVPPLRGRGSRRILASSCLRTGRLLPQPEAGCEGLIRQLRAADFRVNGL